jgi:hypothetical protein
LSLAISCEIKGLAAAPAILPFLKPARRKSPRAETALGELRTIAGRSFAAEAFADARFQATTNSFLPEGNVAAVRPAARPILPPGARSGRRRPRRQISRVSERPPQFAVAFLKRKNSD